MMEKWREIDGFGGRYLVSNFGRVYSNIRECFLSNKKNNGFGYNIVSLSFEGKPVNKYVHRLVAEHFLDFSSKPCVNHIDGNKSNNCANNLEWCTIPENNNHYPGKVYYVTHPEGYTFKVTNLNGFCKDSGLDQAAMWRVSEGRQRNHKGWKCRYDKAAYSEQAYNYGGE